MHFNEMYSIQHTGERYTVQYIFLALVRISFQAAPLFLFFTVLSLSNDDPSGASDLHGQAAPQLQDGLQREEDGPGGDVALTVPGRPHHLPMPYHQPHQQHRGHNFSMSITFWDFDLSEGHLTFT